jgi:protein-S-isoprenylcysteine O-methyltransferase Ste14
VTPPGAAAREPDTLPWPAAAGRWLFQRRTWLPLPLALALVALGATRPVSERLVVTAVGPALVVAGEAIRLWAVRHIGVISRTRADRLGPLVTTGPFAVLRNPLYVGNLLLWAGMACWAGVPWMAAVAWFFFGLIYSFIVRWESHLLEARHGGAYRAYASRVRAWRPRVPTAAELLAPAPVSWRDTLFSERGTLIAIAVMAALLTGL